ncbi:unnamed protein product, partial [Polarella glacialis]
MERRAEQLATAAARTLQHELRARTDREDFALALRRIVAQSSAAEVSELSRLSYGGSVPYDEGTRGAPAVGAQRSEDT